MAAALSSCQNEPSSHFRVDAESYPGFLWSAEKLPSSELILDVSFPSGVEGNLEVQLKMEGVDVNPSSLRVAGDEQLSFDVAQADVPDEDLKLLGSLVLLSSDVNTVNGQPFVPGSFGTVEWQIHRVMNPLAKGLMWLSIALLFLLTVYAFVIRRILRPRFVRPLISMKHPIFSSIRVHRYYRLIIADKKPRISPWKAFIEGKSKVLVITTLQPGMQVVITPQRGGRLNIETNQGRASSRFVQHGTDVKIFHEGTGDVLIHFN